MYNLFFKKDMNEYRKPNLHPVSYPLWGGSLPVPQAYTSGAAQPQLEGGRKESKDSSHARTDSLINLVRKKTSVIIRQ